MDKGQERRPRRSQNLERSALWRQIIKRVSERREGQTWSNVSKVK